MKNSTPRKMMKKTSITKHGEEPLRKQNQEQPKPEGLIQDYLNPRGAANKEEWETTHEPETHRESDPKAKNHAVV
jgi:hypothetical protein